MTVTNSEDKFRQNWELLEAEAEHTRQRSDWFILDAGLAILGQQALLAIGPDNLRHLLIPTTEEELLEDRQSSGVQILKRKLVLKDSRYVTFVDVVCLKNHLHELFALLASDIIGRLDISRPDISKQCLVLLDDWRELFSRESRNILGLDYLTGLFGELVCLREFTRLKPSHLENWSGPSGGIHDFSFPEINLEVKTSRIRNGRFVSIHGINQLLPEGEGKLYLSFIKVEMVRAGGESLPDVIGDIRDAGVNRTELYKQLALLGYDEEHHHYYKKICFRIVEDLLYKVDEAFPRIVPDSFSKGAPDVQVIDVRYKLDITGEPPFPLANDSYKDFIEKYVTA